MALVIGVLGSGRKDGYTIQVLREVLRGAESIEGVETELVHLLDYAFGSCRSCYECIRRAAHRCILKDDMGERGRGKLWQKVEQADGIVLATPVHGWTADALIHLFVERLYPFLWSGELRGIPVSTISVASNQGMQLVANEMLCKCAFTMGARYVGGLPVHTAYLDDAMREARYLGAKTGEAALKDATEGRKALSDEEMWLYYEDTPWNVFAHYIENLTMGTGDPSFSLIRRALVQGTFRNEEAIELLKQADSEFEVFAHHHHLGEREQAVRSLVKASAFWTHATYKEFLEDKLIKAAQPEAYRPIE
jgi:multimeric flavodoxin WrbA